MAYLYIVRDTKHVISLCMLAFWRLEVSVCRRHRANHECKRASSGHRQRPRLTAITWFQSTKADPEEEVGMGQVVVGAVAVYGA